MTAVMLFAVYLQVLAIHNDAFIDLQYLWLSRLIISQVAWLKIYTAFNKCWCFLLESQYIVINYVISCDIYNWKSNSFFWKYTFENPCLWER